MSNLKSGFTAIGTASGLLLLSACGGGGAADSEEMAMVAWGGDSQESFVANAFDPWAENVGVIIKQDSPTDYAKFRAQVDSGKVSWDIVDVEPHFAHTACENGWAEKLATNLIDTSLVKPETVTECAVPSLEYGVTIGYNTEAFPDDHPTNWAEFFDTETFPGKRGFWRYATAGIFESALLADGVSPEELYPLDIDRAFEKLDTIKDDIIFYETGEQQQQLLASGEAPLIQAWHGRVFLAAQEGQPVANEWNSHLLAYDQWVIPKGAGSADLAQQWLAWYLEHPEAQAGYSNDTAYGPVTEAALDHVEPEVLSELPAAPENAAKRAAIIDYEYWAENYGAVSERLNEWAAQ